jgi:hypothetical protein
MNHDPDQHDEDLRDPATRAFDALRDELLKVRQSVESLNVNIQQSRPYDNRKTLGQILRAQEGVETELQAMKSHPAISLTPDGFVRQLESSKNELLKVDQQNLRVVVDALKNNCIVLKNYVDEANEAALQKLMIAGAAFLFFCIGTLFSVTTVSTIVNLAPKSWHAPERIASSILEETMRNAGIRLIQTNNPSEWELINYGKDFMHKYYDTIEKCKKETIETRKETKCTISIK